MNNLITVPIELCREGAVVPQYGSEQAAGMDIYATEDIVILAGTTKIIPTGIKMELPEGTECQVRDRSGLASSTKLRVANAPGTVDSDFRDEVGIILENTSPDYDEIATQIATRLSGDIHLKLNKVKELYPVNKKDPNFVRNAIGDYIIRKGERIAQVVFTTHLKAELEVVDKISTEVNRNGGFGSTGV